MYYSYVTINTFTDNLLFIIENLVSLVIGVLTGVFWKLYPGKLLILPDVTDSQTHPPSGEIGVPGVSQDNVTLVQVAGTCYTGRSLKVGKARP